MGGLGGGKKRYFYATMFEWNISGGKCNYAKWLEAKGILSLNNVHDNDWNIRGNVKKMFCFWRSKSFLIFCPPLQLSMLFKSFGMFSSATYFHTMRKIVAQHSSNSIKFTRYFSLLKNSVKQYARMEYVEHADYNNC